MAANPSLTLQKGPAQKTDALILQGMDGQALNDLSPAPHAICSIGQIMCLALKRDFDLIVPEGPQPQLLRHTRFRGALVQVAGAMHGAFMDAQGSMQQLGLQMADVPEHLKYTVTYLLNKDGLSPNQMGRHVSRELQEVEKVGESCLKLAQDTHQKFAGVSALLWEMIEMLTVKRGASEKEKEELLLQKQLAADASKILEEKKQHLQTEMVKVDKEAAEAKDQMQKVMASKPRTRDLIGAAFAEASCSLLQSLAQCAGPALIAGATRAATQSTPVTPVAAPVVPPPQPNVSTFPEIPSAAIDVVATIAAAANREFAPQIDLVMGAAKALVHALKGGSAESITKEDGQNMAKQLKVFEGVLNSTLSKAEKATDSGLAKDAASLIWQLLEPMKRAGMALQEGDRRMCAELSSRADGILRKTQELEVKKASILQGNVLPPAQIFQQPTSACGSGIGDRMVGLWKVQAETAKQLLLEANRKRDKEFRRLEELNEKLLANNQKMARVKIEDLKVDEVIEILKQAIRQFGACQEAWSRLVQLFMYINQLTQYCCSKQIQDFVGKASQVSLDIQQGDPFTRCLRDQIYQMVVRTSQTAFTAQHLAKAYNEISEEHFVAPLASVTRIMGMELGQELEQERQQLIERCEAANEAVKKKVLEQRTKTKSQIQDRLQEICDVMDKEFGEVPEEVRNLVSHAVQEVRDGASYAAPSVVDVLNPEDLVSQW